MATKRSIEVATALAAYLLRGLWRRVDWTKIPSSRRRGIAEELAGALVPLAVSERSTLGFVRALCTRFEINPSGGGYVDGAGAERSAGPAYALLPRALAPEGLPEMEHRAAHAGEVAVRWDHVCKAIDFESLRIALHENPAFFATFVHAEPVDGEEELFASGGDATERRPWTATLPGRLITPRALRTVWTLASPMAHGHDEKHGNVVLFRRQRQVSPVTGEQSLVPFVAGNAVRGMWRDLAMDRMLRLLGLSAAELPPARAHALLAGGTIEAGADSSKPDPATRRRAREMCPAFDLLAGTIDNQIMRGLLRVHDATLVCRENAWMLHSLLAPKRDGEPLAFEDFAAALPAADDLVQLRLATRHAHRDLEGADGSQMIFNTEVILPGAQMLHRVQIIGSDGRAAPELAGSCLADLLGEFRDSAFVGAGNARGLGSIGFDPYAPGDGEPDLPPPDLYRAWIAEHADEVRSWLCAGAQPVAKPAPKGRRGKAVEPVEAGGPEF